MNKTRNLVIGLLIAAVVAIVVAFFAVKMGDKPKVADQGPALKQWHYVTVSRDVVAGERLTAESLVMTTWTNSVPDEGALESTDKAIGRLAALPMHKGTILSEDLLAPLNAAIGLPQKIPTGMRAIAIKTDPETDFSGFLTPDSHVDVYMSMQGAAGSATGTTQTLTLLENVPVVATGTQLVNDPSGKAQEHTVVTLLVTPDQARKVALAEQNSKLSLALRNPEEDNVVDGKVVTQYQQKATYLSELVGTRSVVAAEPLKHIKPMLIEPSPDRLELVLGSQHTVQTYRNNVLVGQTETPGGTK